MSIVPRSLSEARLEGNVVAEEVVVGGDLIGSIRALSITLQSKSHVEADLVHQSLAIEDGAFFNGKSCPSKNPLLGDSASRNQTQAEPPSVSRKSQKDGVDSGHPVNHPQ